MSWLRPISLLDRSSSSSPSAMHSRLPAFFLLYFLPSFWLPCKAGRAFPPELPLNRYACRGFPPHFSAGTGIALQACSRGPPQWSRVLNHLSANSLTHPNTDAAFLVSGNGSSDALLQLHHHADPVRVARVVALCHGQQVMLWWGMHVAGWLSLPPSPSADVLNGWHSLSLPPCLPSLRQRLHCCHCVQTLDPSLFIVHGGGWRQSGVDAPKT